MQGVTALCLMMAGLSGSKKSALTLRKGKGQCLNMKRRHKQLEKAAERFLKHVESVRAAERKSQ